MAQRKPTEECIIRVLSGREGSFRLYIDHIRRSDFNPERNPEFLKDIINCLPKIYSPKINQKTFNFKAETRLNIIKFYNSINDINIDHVKLESFIKSEFKITYHYIRWISVEEGDKSNTIQSEIRKLKDQIKGIVKERQTNKNSNDASIITGLICILFDIYKPRESTKLEAKLESFFNCYKEFIHCYRQSNSEFIFLRDFNKHLSQKTETIINSPKTILRYFKSLLPKFKK